MRAGSVPLNSLLQCLLVCLLGQSGCLDTSILTPDDLFTMSSQDASTMADGGEEKSDLVMLDLAGVPQDLAPNIQIIATNSLANAKDDGLFGACNGRKAAQDFIPTITGKITKLRVRLRKVGNPADNVVCKIYKGGNIPEEGQLLAASQPVPAAQIMAMLMPPGPMADITFDLQNQPQLQAGLKYFFVFERTGALDCAEVNVYRLGNGDNLYPNGQYWIKWQTDMLAGWSANLYPQLDFVFEVYADVN
jgi:hypothetical protein